MFDSTSDSLYLTIPSIFNLIHSLSRSMIQEIQPSFILSHYKFRQVLFPYKIANKNDNIKTKTIKLPCLEKTDLIHKTKLQSDELCKRRGAKTKAAKRRAQNEESFNW